MHPLLGWQQLFLEVVSKPHLASGSCIAPRSGIRANSITLRCITDLFKMLTYFLSAGKHDFFIGLRLLNSIILIHRCEIPLVSGALERDRGFEATSKPLALRPDDDNRPLRMN